MKRTNAEIVGGFGSVLTVLGSFGVGACTVALIVALAQSGNTCGALGVGIVLSAVLVYAGNWFTKLATLGEILGGVGNGRD